MTLHVPHFLAVYYAFGEAMNEDIWSHTNMMYRIGFLINIVFLAVLP